VRKLLHKPTTAIRTAAREGDSERLKALADLWREDE